MGYGNGMGDGGWKLGTGDGRWNRYMGVGLGSGWWNLIWELSWAVVGGKLTRCARSFLLSYAGVVRLDSLFPQCLPPSHRSDNLGCAHMALESRFSCGVTLLM